MNNEPVKRPERYTVSVGGSSQYFLCTTDRKQPSVSLVGEGTLMQTKDYDRDIKALVDACSQVIDVAGNTRFKRPVTAKLVSDAMAEIVNCITDYYIKVDRQAATIQRLEEFIRNGIEYGYIQRPESGDPANETIDAALKATT